MLYSTWKSAALRRDTKLAIASELCDTVCGVVGCGFILSYDNFSRILEWIDLRSVLISTFQQIEEDPFGLKFNKTFGKFCSEVYKALFITQMALSSPIMSLRMMLGLTSLFSLLGGFSWGIAFIYDWLGLIYFMPLIYISSALRRGLMQTLRGMRLLILLFQGYKWNRLRERVEQAKSTTIDSLVSGALLFTILGGILPTLAVYALVANIATIYYKLYRFIIMSLWKRLRFGPLPALLISSKCCIAQTTYTKRLEKKTKWVSPDIAEWYSQTEANQLAFQSLK